MHSGKPIGSRTGDHKRYPQIADISYQTVSLGRGVSSDNDRSFFCCKTAHRFFCSVRSSVRIGSFKPDTSAGYTAPRIEDIDCGLYAAEHFHTLGGVFACERQSGSDDHVGLNERLLSEQHWITQDIVGIDAAA